MRRALTPLILLLAAPALADVVELRSGERVEGKLEQATQSTVTIEVGGRAVTFRADQVKSIHFGSPPAGAAAPAPAVAGTPSATPGAAAALSALHEVESMTRAGPTYSAYAGRVLDARAAVDRFLREPGGVLHSRPAARALEYYELALDAWRARLTDRPPASYVSIGQRLDGDPSVLGCAAMKDLVARGEATAARLGRRGEERLRTLGMEASHALPVIWSCASAQIAEAERLAARRK